MVNLLICILLGIVLYYTMIRLSHPGLGVLYFTNEVSFDTYVFVDSDNYRYAIDEVFVTFGGAVRYHVAIKGQQTEFDIGKMERPYKYIARCNIKTFTKTSRIIQRLKQLEHSYNLDKDLKAIQIDSLKIPIDSELAPIKLYSDAFQDALKWVIEKALLWNDFLNGYMPSRVRETDGLVKIKLEVLCLFKAIKVNKTRNDVSIPTFLKFDVFDEIRSKHETSRKLFWSWDHLVSYSLLHQIRSSLEILADILANNKTSIAIPKASTILTTDSSLRATIRNKRRDLYLRNAQYRKKRRYRFHPLASPLMLVHTTKSTRQRIHRSRQNGL